MKESKNALNIVWLKRDFRLEDHEALYQASEDEDHVLLVFCYEESIYSDAHYSDFHLDFIKQSLVEMNASLQTFETKVLSIQAEVIPFLDWCKAKFGQIKLWSSQETGLNLTFQRDIRVGQWCKTNGIEWEEFQNNGVIRGLKDRSTWSADWGKFMRRKIKPINLHNTNFLSLTQIEQFETNFKAFGTSTKPKIEVQKGGHVQAKFWLDTFLESRHEGYNRHISKPVGSRLHCSRLSPYIAWGNISIRQIYQQTVQRKKEIKDKRNLSSFMSRLRWQSHFIQKFEMEPRMEFEAHNKGFLNIGYEHNEKYIKAWKKGQTGFPLVDASIRCLMATGYVNFRMRTMISSFFSHLLFQHFAEIGPWLARNFLDFEPGIHYPQLQMQSGLTGYNTVRIYNPTKNAKDHDPEAIFIKRYVPELRNLPPNLAIEPWTLTAMESELYEFDLERDYFLPIVDMAEARKIALSKLYGHRKEPLAKKEKERILNRHTIPRRDNSWNSK
ncbi:cryptochrome/deoxyribodipyrimidine photo-lyase family protein [Costertonia aggregata]|uniref:Deoxyribodipyrimidine photo-lyase n=1 Tax=Costertonia aggregata TaxID=343403 RepID=A0A7H9ASQ5_9FLAO|nr:FAD-binding domain-containing protein [Costertonia aggregata]QLG46484.1 deoxyribodipyrimidine photo-lyase [Costertonia aggregata]